MWAIVAALFFLQSVDHSAEGMKALEEAKYEVAVQEFQKAIESDPKDYTAHFNLALAYGFLHKDEEGIAEYRKTLELKPGLYEAQLNGGILLMRKKMAAEALPLFAAAVELKPQEYRPRYYLAEAQLETAALEQAEASYKKALELDPKAANAELGLAHALARQAKLGDSEPHFRRAGELDPKYRDYLLELASLWEQAKQPAEAIKIYREFPENVAAREHLGQLMLESKQYADAIPQLEGAYGKDPTAANRLALAEAYVFTGQNDKALPLLQQAVAEDAANFELRMIYARALRDKRQFPAAAAQFYEAAKLQPRQFKTWDELGDMLYMMGDSAKAFEAFSKAHELGDDTPGNWFFRAILLDKLRQLKPAVEAYQHFLSISKGGFPDQEFQARHRLVTLKNELEKR
ncbi:MAG TPA: tetratricopeptide repeat protein [Bryobacteraceae bacterium]|nr:tetratricopeptide repeat protein [Bryobacteraceae bacterium]